MKNPSLKKALASALILVAAGYSGIGLAHSGGAVLGADGANASATGLAAITCFDDGNGEPDSLFAQIKDLSDPVPGLLINIQLYKGVQATNITDTVSGDANPSTGITLQGGPGVYWLLVNKTDVGPRAFELIWHCLTSDGTHTGTDITVRQFQ